LMLRWRERYDDIYGSESRQTTPDAPRHLHFAAFDNAAEMKNNAVRQSPIRHIIGEQALLHSATPWTRGGSAYVTRGATARVYAHSGAPRATSRHAAASRTLTVPREYCCDGGAGEAKG